MKIISIFDDVLEKISRWGLVTSLFIILLFSVLSIVLRWMGMSPSWLEPMVRHVVFISAFFGGSLATSKDVHIKVDLMTKLVEASSSNALKWLQRNVVTLFCLVTCILLAKSGYDFFLVEKEFGAESFMGIHSSMLVGIIPAGMGLISLRFLNRLLLGLSSKETHEHRTL